MRILTCFACFGISLLLVIPGSISSETHSPDIHDSGLTLKLLSKITEPAWAMGNEAKILIHKNKLFIPLGYPGLSVYDINDPRSPRPLSRIHSDDLGGQAGAMAASGDRLYMVMPDEKKIAMLDISDPSSPVVMERFGQFQQNGDLSTAGQFLYLQTMSSTSYFGGFQIYDISGSSPHFSGEYPLELVDPGFFVSETGHVFLARTPATMNDSAKIDCIDASDPAYPVLIDQWRATYPGNITDIHLRDGKLYCSAYWGGIWILDAQDYANLALDSYFDWEDRASVALSVRAFPPYVFVAQGGPQPSHEKFGVYRYGGGGLQPETEIPIPEGTRTHSVYLKDNLLVLVFFENPWEDSTPEKTLMLYRIKTGKPALNISASVGGTTIPAPGTYRYDKATSVTITAASDTHYTFEHWSGGASTNVNPITLEVNADISIQANFLREIYPPVDAMGTRRVNRSLFFREYIDILTWQDDPGNERIEKYRIYEFLQSSHILLGETDAQTRTFWHRGVEGHRVYSYAIAAVNEEGREGRASIVTIK